MSQRTLTSYVTPGTRHITTRRGTKRRIGKGHHTPKMRGAATLASASTDLRVFSDIFDVPARMIEHGSGKCTYLPSELWPPVLSKTMGMTGDGAVTVPKASLAPRSMSTLARPQSDVLLFDGPARPIHRPAVTSRHRKVSTVSSKVVHIMHTPEIFDGPSRPRHRISSMHPKSKVSIFCNSPTISEYVNTHKFCYYENSRSLR